jgi:hypothetical protein
MFSVLDKGETGAGFYIGQDAKFKFQNESLSTVRTNFQAEVMLHHHLSQLSRKAVSRFWVRNSVSLSHICRNYNIFQFIFPHTNASLFTVGRMVITLNTNYVVPKRNKAQS